MLVYRTLKKIAYPLFKSKLKEVRGAEYLPRKGGYILAANHVDWLDGFYIAAAIGQARNVPVYFLTKSNYYWWTSVTIQIPADHRRDAIAVGVRGLQAGKVFCNFIEGQRNPSRGLLPGKTGTVRMAMAAGAPVIPVGIACTPSRTMAKSMMHLFSNNHPVSIRIGQPINFQQADPEKVSLNELREKTDQVMRAIAPLAGKQF